MGYSRIQSEIEELSEIVYCDRGIVNGTVLLQITVSTMRDDTGLHEIIYLDSNDHDHLYDVITSVYKEFMQSDNNWNWPVMIDTFEQSTGIDFYTLISFIYLMQSTKRTLSTTAEISTAVICSSVLMKYCNGNVGHVTNNNFNNNFYNSTPTPTPTPTPSVNQTQVKDLNVNLPSSNMSELGFTKVVR